LEEFARRVWETLPSVAPQAVVAWLVGFGHEQFQRIGRNTAKAFSRKGAKAQRKD
jgi:hypothetical protein